MLPWTLAAATLVAHAEPGAATDDAPSAQTCPWAAQSMGRTDGPCARPGPARAFAIGTGTVVGAAAGWWMLVGGDSLYTGDPGSQAAGVAGTMVAGAVLGAVTSALSGRPETTVPDRPGRATVRLRLGQGGTSVIDEREPTSVMMAVDPTLKAGDEVQVQPHLSWSPGFTSQSVDPRPQATAIRDGLDGTFPVGRTLRRSRVRVAAEAAWRPTLEGAERGRLEARWRPTAEWRWRTLSPGEPEARTTRLLAFMPANVGFRWHVSPRQRLTVLMGPRFDAIGDVGAGSGGLIYGTLYAESTYQIDVPISRGTGDRVHKSSRLNLGYVHSNLDGQALDTGAVVGFFGPLELSWDLRLRPRDAAAALQLTLGSTVTRGGGPFLQIGGVLGKVP